MNKPRCKVMVAFFAYGGNGGIAGMSPDLAMWWAKTYHNLKTDPKVDFVGAKVYSDTPITMTRNRAVADAKAAGADMILMLDSDNVPDGYEGFQGVKPFWNTSFEFAYERLLKGIPTVIAAPYCGPPPPPVDPIGYENHGEVPYIFQWTNKEGDDPHAVNKLDLMTRAEASKIAGIYPVAALPTGVCLFTLNCFEGLKHPHFYYEWNEDYSEKKSTEDVTATRDIGLFWKMTKGYDVLFANFDAWAFHVKTKKVGRPVLVTAEAISGRFTEAIRENWSRTDEIRAVDFTEGLGAAETAGKVKEVKKSPKPKSEAPEALKRDYVLHGPVENLPPPPVDISRIPTRDQVLGPNDNYVRVPAEEWAELLGEEPEAAVAVAERPKPQNGQALRYKMVGQRKVAILEYELSEDTVESIQSITNWLVGKLEGGIDVSVVHPGTGQGTAAIVSCLPGMSRLLAFDSTSQYHSAEYAKHFTRTFEKELESGLVKANVDGKQFPDVRNYRADMAFIENFVTAGKLETWLKAVSPKGVLCGLGFDQPEIMDVVEQFRVKHGLPIQTNGSLWVLPVGGIADAVR